MLHKIKGTGVALVTPFNSDHSIDFNGLSKLVNHCINGNIDFLVVMGTTAESATLSLSEKQDVLEHVKKINNNRLPIVLGLGGNNTQSVINSFSQFQLDGLSAILSVSPAYNKPTQEGIYQHFRAISLASPLPIILYNVPSRTSSNMTAQTTLRLAHEFDNITAIKEASGDLEQIMTIIKNKPSSFSVLSGDDALTLPILFMGGSGVISVLAQGLPKEFSAMVQYGLEKNVTKANSLHYKLIDFVKPLFLEGNPAGIKSMLNTLDICQKEVRLPLVMTSNSIDEKIKKELVKLEAS